MKQLDIPFNITLLTVDDRLTGLLRAVKSVDTFDGNTKNFHPDGLYSVDTFGVVGTPARDIKFGYIDLKIKIIHPLIYKTVTSMKTLYKDIMASREFAIWDKDLKDFIKSNPIDGNTGYEFFIEHFEDISYGDATSTKRDQSTQLLRKFKGQTLIDKVIVIPAGLRDIEIDENGRASSDEINELYYKLIAYSNTINPSTVKISPEAYNAQRMSMQNTFIEIYDYIMTIVEGKKNLMMGKWASRKIFNGTRNVITSDSAVSQTLGDKNNITINDTGVGLFQAMKSILPITVYHLRNEFLNKVFSAVGAAALLTNKKTLKSERVILQAHEYEPWLTNEGLEKQIEYFRENTIRHTEITVGDYYLGLTYRGPDGSFKLINGVDELPEDRRKEDCTPITFAELFYSSIYHVANKHPVFVTRYPITGIGSVYPSWIYLKSTVNSEQRFELGDDWKPLGEDRIAKEYPVKDSSFFNAMSPHGSRLLGLTADFDGKCIAVV